MNIIDLFQTNLQELSSWLTKISGIFAFLATKVVPLLMKSPFINPLYTLVYAIDTVKAVAALIDDAVHLRGMSVLKLDAWYVLLCALITLIFVVYFWSIWRFLSMADIPGWKCFIPFYREYLLLDLFLDARVFEALFAYGMFSVMIICIAHVYSIAVPFLLLAALFPVLIGITYFITIQEIGGLFERSGGWIFLMHILPPIFVPLTAFTGEFQLRGQHRKFMAEHDRQS